MSEVIKKRKHEKYAEAEFRGYPGLTNTSKQICDYIPRCKIFVEPFAGLGRISKRVKADKYVLNDLSDYAINFLKNNFKNAQITQHDYANCIKDNDSEDTMFFIDPPWIDNVYEKNRLTAYTKPNREIYDDLEETLPKIKGDWIIAGKADGVLKNWRYHHLEIKSRQKAIFGFKARTYLVSNKPFVNHHQYKLFGD